VLLRKCAIVGIAYPSLFASSEILTGECLQHNDPVRNNTSLLVDPFRLAILTGHRDADVMTQKTFIFTKHLLLVSSAALSIVLVIFLEVTA
jgi:hypothetical protein